MWFVLDGLFLKRNLGKDSCTKSLLRLGVVDEGRSGIHQTMVVGRQHCGQLGSGQERPQAWL